MTQRVIVSMRKIAGNFFSSLNTRENKLLAGLFLLSFLLYLPGVWWGLPHATVPDRIFGWAPDELGPLGPVAELYSVFISPDPTFNPQYPLFHYFLQAVFVAPYLLFLLLTGGFSQPSVEYPFGLSNPVQSLAIMTTLARSVSLLLASGVTVVSYKIGKTLWGIREGILSAIFAMLLYPMFYYARTSNVDMGTLFWISLGLLIFAEILVGDFTTRNAFLLGLFAALAIATKDASYAFFVTIAPILLILVLQKNKDVAGGKRALNKNILIGAITFVISYAVASGFIFSPERFIEHVRFVVRGSDAGRGIAYFNLPPTLESYITLLGESMLHISRSMGIPMAILSLVGIVVTAQKTPKYLYILLPGFAMILGIVLPTRFILFRFAFFTSYVLVFFAAYGISTFLAARTKFVSRLAWGGLVILAALSLARGADLTYQMIFDSRYTAAQWLEEHAKPGDRVGFYGAALKLPPLSKDIETVPMPGQPFVDTDPNLINDPPEFVVIIPQQEFETVHEWTLSEEDYQSLVDGSTGFQWVLQLKSPSLFLDQPITFVNPNVQIFVRKDYLSP